MKRAILIGFVAMAPVAGCGSDGTPNGRRGVLVDPVGGQAPPSDPDSPPSDPQTPLTNPQAPPSDPDAPPVSNTNPTGGSPARAPSLDCPTLCGSVGSCLPTCAQYCTDLGSVTGPCLAPLNAFLACASGAFTLSCNNRGDRISINLANSCVDQARAAVECLGVDISVRGPQTNDGPPPGQ